MTTAGVGLLAASPSEGAVVGPITLAKKSAYVQICEIRPGSDGQPWVIWRSDQRQARRNHQRAWMAKLTSSGRLTERELLFHSMAPPYPKQGFGWNSSCPTVAPGEGRALDVIWQRTKTSYYPTNAMIGVSKPSALVRRSRDASGKWGAVKAWLQASKASYWSSVEGVRWIATEGRAGLLLLQRRMKTGSNGLRVDVARRDASGRWGTFHPDRRDFGARRLERTVAGSAGRIAQLFAAEGAQTALMVMAPGDRRFGAAIPLPAADGCRRVEGPEALRIATTETTISTAWPCKLAGGSIAVAITQLGWDGGVRSRRLLADHRAVEDAALAPAEAYPGARRPGLTLGALVADGERLRLSWLRQAPFAPEGAMPQVFEATVDQAGNPTESTVLTLPPIGPAADFWSDNASSPEVSYGQSAGSSSFVISARALGTATLNRVVFVRRGDDGGWRSEAWTLPAKVEASDDQPSVLVGGTIFTPVRSDYSSVGLLGATLP